MKNKVKKISNNFFFILIVDMLVDPTNQIFGLKLPIFFFFIISMLATRDIEIKGIFIVLLYYLLIFSTSIILYTRDIPYDLGNNISYYTSGVVLILLTVSKDDEYDYLKAIYFSGVIISLFTIAVFTIFTAFPILYGFTSKVPFIEINFYVFRRAYFGYPITMVFHKASPILMFAFGFKYLDYLKSKSKAALLLSALFMFTLFLSGTRANILSVLGIFFAATLLYWFQCKKKIFLSVLTTEIGIISFLLLVIALLTVGSDNSSDIKAGHLESILEIFSHKPLYFFTGMGPGSIYYSKGFEREVFLTEITYMEFLRMFGFFGLVLMIMIYYYPVISILVRRKSIIFALIILSYLFIGGTNPLLIGNVGFVALLVSYSICNRFEYFRDKFLW